MSEQGTEFNDIEVEDTEAHVRVAAVDGPDTDDTEGHVRVAAVDGPDTDDVEGHVQPPRGDDTDHLHS